MRFKWEKYYWITLKNNKQLQGLFMICVLTVFIGVSGNVLHAETPTVKGIINSLLGPDDTTPPDIELEGLSDGLTVYTEKMYISGQVTDNNKVTALTLDKVPLISRPERNIFFSHLTALREGKNIITIEANDEAGNKTRKEIIVVRTNPHFSKLPKEVFEKRMRLAVYPFDYGGALSEESGMFLDMLTLALQEQGRFQLTDRVLMDTILKEQKLSLTQLIDQEIAVRTGRIMSAQAIVTGSIIKSGEGIEVAGRMIDTETAEILAIEKIYSSKEGLAALNFLAQSLAVRFHNDFPMLKGVVVQRKVREIFTDVSRNSPPLRGNLIIYRENNLKNVILGYARITQSLPEMTKAELTSGRLDEIRELDRVVVQ
ncbi:MAG: hypothetical protein C4538_01505 [Nitrospiraceae bacterium]|nr:MAG: hypothetical protein C4538_01505 [Nitrospiraceae bacterium]